MAVNVSGDDEAVRVEVHNEGPAIPADLLPMIFEPLFRSNDVGANATHGIGLGLYIVSHIVSSHGGRIDVTSSDDGGTRFTVYLPRRGPAPATG